VADPTPIVVPNSQYRSGYWSGGGYSAGGNSPSLYLSPISMELRNHWWNCGGRRNLQKPTLYYAETPRGWARSYTSKVRVAPAVGRVDVGPTPTKQPGSLYGPDPSRLSTHTAQRLAAGRHNHNEQYGLDDLV
jgi:hypothetical protein